jgi:N-acetylmuramoyl-L-alanine amidase
MPRVVVRGGWGAAVALVVCGAAAGADADTVAELRAIAVRPAADGAAVVIELSRPSTPRIDVVQGAGGALRRIHVDLASGTRIGPRAVPASASAPPVERVRVGVADQSRTRVVIEVAGARDYRVDDGGGGGTIVLTVLSQETRAPAAGTTAQAPAATTTAQVPATSGTARAPAAAPPTRTHAARPRPRIVLDPGHGGDDPGATGYAVEKDVTLDVARRLAALLRLRLGAEVVLTREGDDTLALKDRTARANEEAADLFVSIHANANPTGRSHGVETYYLDNSTDRGTLRLAQMENGLDLLTPEPGEASLRYILSDLVQVGKLDDSVRLARSLQRGLVGHLRRRHANVVDLGVKRGPFYVLVGAYMPCVLVEVAFLTHPVEGRRLARRDYRAEVAEGLYSGIARFLTSGQRRRTL